MRRSSRGALAAPATMWQAPTSRRPIAGTRGSSAKSAAGVLQPSRGRRRPCSAARAPGGLRALMAVRRGRPCGRCCGSRSAGQRGRRLALLGPTASGRGRSLRSIARSVGRPARPLVLRRQRARSTRGAICARGRPRAGAPECRSMRCFRVSFLVRSRATPGSRAQRGGVRGRLRDAGRLYSFMDAENEFIARSKAAGHRSQRSSTAERPSPRVASAVGLRRRARLAFRPLLRLGTAAHAERSRSPGSSSFATVTTAATTAS